MTIIKFDGTTQESYIVKETVTGFFRDGSQLHVFCGGAAPQIVNFASIKLAQAAETKFAEDLKGTETNPV